MQAIEALLKRRSARTLTAPAPDAGTLDLIFESAARAPDHGRLRPWRFIVIEGAARERLGAVLVEHVRRMHPGTPEDALHRERQKAFRAPLIVVVAAIIDPAAKIPAIEQILSAGAAAQNILLAAVALGFNGVWKTGGAAYDDTVKIELGLAPKDAIVGFLYLGTESQSARDTPPAATLWRDKVEYWSR
jgi:nitroreductase